MVYSFQFFQQKSRVVFTCIVLTNVYKKIFVLLLQLLMNKKEEQFIIDEFVDVRRNIDELVLQTKEDVVQVVQMSFIACRVDDWFKLNKSKYSALAASLKKYQAYKHITDQELLSMLKSPLQKFLYQTHAVLNEYTWDQFIDGWGSVPFINGWTVENIEQAFSALDPKAQKDYLVELRKLRKSIKQ